MRMLTRIARAFFFITISTAFVCAGAFFLWAAQLKMPSWDSVESRRVEQSTKIYDRTGSILLYDLHQDVRRTIVPISEISRHIKNATVAIEDDNFYNHRGVEPTAIVRAVVNNIQKGNLLGGQGGSTITQQVVKNTLLESEKSIARKFKEWVLAFKLEQSLTKDEILELYLNESPYGGNRYGVEEASRAFFAKSARDLSVAEAAYLAALPQAPTYLSPYGNHRDALERRKDLVLERMLALGFITEEEYAAAKIERVAFQPQQNTGINAPHFVFFVIDELRKVYSERELQESGLRVITSLDFTLQKKAEEIVLRNALSNEKRFNAKNAALVAQDPRNGDVLVMVGSRDYFDDAIEGNFNVAIARRQPGSSFKPLVYAAAFLKGYTPETVVFDVPTQFSTACRPDNITSTGGCYAPVNYDGIFRGPISFRNALAQSVNVPAVKALYLAGLRESIQLAEKLGIGTLGNPDQYGLTLVLGGGEVRLVDMVGAYGVFAREGKKAERRPILRIEDRHGKVLRNYPPAVSEVLDQNTTRQINSILSDNTARTPAFGSNSFLHFPGRDVAAKTGTTNEYRDAWIVGYTPEIVVGAWAGNNDNSPMNKQVAGFIVAPLWNEFMKMAFDSLGETTTFTPPEPTPSDIKPILRGVWGGTTVVIDTASGKLATEATPPEFRKEVTVGDVHSILHWVNKSDPRGPIPTNPSSDPQYALWEYGVSQWRQKYGAFLGTSNIPNEVDDSRSGDKAPKVSIVSPVSGKRYENTDTISAFVSVTPGAFSIKKVDYFVNGTFVGSASIFPYTLSIPLEGLSGLLDENTLSVIVYDEILNRASDSVDFLIR